MCLITNYFSVLLIYVLWFKVAPFVFSQSTELVSSEHLKTGSESNKTTNTSKDSGAPKAEPENLSQDGQETLKFLQEKGLYYDLSSIMEDINKNKLKSGIVDLMSVHNRSQWISTMRQNYQSRDQIKKKKRMIFINIESVYNSKREMITKAVSRRYRGKQMTSPPKFMSDIRVIVGKGIARKLYYSITKYSTAVHVQQALSTQAVVLEKYWLHHAAFIISKAFNETELPPRGHPIYRWPKDLLAPDILFFINATKNVGAETGFYQEYTPFTERLIEVFRRVEGVKVVELNPSQKYQVVVRQIINYVNTHFKDHPYIVNPSFLGISHYQQNINVKR